MTRSFCIVQTIVSYLLLTTSPVNGLSTVQLQNGIAKDYMLTIMDIISKSFVEFWCIQIANIGYRSLEILRNIHHLFLTPVSSIGDDTCKGIILISDEDTSVMDVLSTIKLTAESRLFVVVLSSSDSVLYETAAFGDAEVALFTPGKKRFLQTSKHTRYFEDIRDAGLAFPTKRNVFADLKGRTLQTGTFTCPPFSYTHEVPDSEKDVMNDSDSLDGIEMLAFLELSRRLNFTWELQEVKEKNKWGRLEHGFWNGGVLGRLANRSADVAFCALWIAAEQSEFADFTVPWNQLCNTFLVPRTGRKLSWNAVFRSLDIIVWADFVFLVVLTSITLATVTKLQLSFQSADVSKIYGDYGRSLLEIMGMLVLANSPSEESRLGASRHVICWWSLFTLLATTAYSSGLVSHLTVPLINSPLDSVRDLVEHNFRWTQSYFPSVNSIFDVSNIWHKKFIERFEDDSGSGMKGINYESKYALFGYKLEGSVLYFLEAEEGRSRDWRSLRVMKECMSRYYIALGLVKNSPYTKAFNLALRRLHESGIMGYWQKNVILRRGNINVTSVFVDDTSRSAAVKPEVLSLKNIEGAFYIFFIGMSIAVVVFLTELSKLILFYLPW